MHHLTRIVTTLAASVWLQTALAIEVGGVEIPPTTTVGETTLQLNGAGIRKKFFFSIYAAGLYLSDKRTDSQGVLDLAGPKRLYMQFIYDKVEKAKLDEAWIDGFKANLSPEAHTALRSDITRFVGLFGDAKKGDYYRFDWDGNQSVININGQTVATIPGKAFYDALLSIWIGGEPVTMSLRDALLGR